MSDQDPLAAAQCPDGGACHHRCLSGCWRVLYAGPLSGVYADDTWPRNVRRGMNLVQDGLPAETPGAMHWGSRPGRVLAFLHQFLALNGYPPSVQQIADAVGLTSTSSVAYQLQVLETQGHIVRVPGAARAITLITPPPTTET